MGQDVFGIISKELERISAESPLMSRRKNEHIKWSYSVCGTPIQINKGVVIGINWGGGSDKDQYSYEVQEKMPTIEEYREELAKGGYSFLERSRHFLSHYLDVDVNEGQFNYTNLCFFRSPKAKELNAEDYELSLPVFQKFVELVQPTWILSLSISNCEYLQEHFDTLIVVKPDKSKHVGYRGKLFGVPFYGVPHPNAQVQGEDREAIWQKVFEVESQRLR